jgi:small-conductance mechanosensitive channel
LDVFGVKLVGLSQETGRKLLLTLALFAAVWLLSAAGRFVIRLLRGRKSAHAAVFWGQQSFSLAAVALLVVGLISIWFNGTGQLATIGGIATAGIAFGLQKPITAVAGYFVVLRSRVFTVGDRITMSGVRGDVISLTLLQTSVMEMGQPASVEEREEPAIWVHSRQYTGRVVTVTNDKVFDQPIYNYTREFPFLWEEMRVPITFKADRGRAEAILLEAAGKHSEPIQEVSLPHLEQLRDRYGVDVGALAPRVYYRITNNWLELAVRFLVGSRGSRQIKDAMTREILAAFDAAGIEIASTRYDIMGLPRVHIERDGALH